MAKNAPPPAQGAISNSMLTGEQMQLVEKLTQEIQSFEKERGAINDSIGERRSAIKALGIDMDAWRAAKRRREMDPEDRANFDQSAAACNAALGVPIQADLFPDDKAGAAAGLPGGLH